MTDINSNTLIRGTRSDLIAWLVMSIWPSHLGLPLLLAIIIFSKRVQRHPTFISMCITWIVSGFCSSILLYAGKATGPEPPKLLCLVQASLLYGVPPMAAMGAFLLVFQMFSVIRSSFQRGEKKDMLESPLRLCAMLAAPYILFFAFAVATAFVGAASPDKVSRNRRYFYCSVRSGHLTDTLSLVSAIVLVATLILEAWTIIILYRGRVALRRQGSHLRTSVELSLPIRTIIFGLYVAVGMSLSVVNMKSPTSPVPDLMLATTSGAVVLLFGSQPDILRVVCFWRRAESKIASTPQDLPAKLSYSSEKPFYTP
jgi:hypothetical protein